MRYFRKALAVIIIALAYYYLFWVLPPSMEGDFSDGEKIWMFHVLMVGLGGSALAIVWALIELFDNL